MKYYKIIGRANIHGAKSDDDLKALDGYFESEYEPFDDNLSIEEVDKLLCDKYKVQLEIIKSFSETLILRED